MDFRGPTLPHRKPIPIHFGQDNGNIQPLSKILPDPLLPDVGPTQSAANSHSRTRTASSTIFPQGLQSLTSSPPSSHANTINASRRTPSTATTSSTASNPSNGILPARTHSTVSIHLRRSTSSRSGGSITPTSYVALMRKQKATVWCDRAQHEDPRMLAQQKAAKMRATMEVIGANTQGRNSTSGSMGSGSLGVRSKIRHHGAPKAVGYSGANLVGGGVPMRLSASEVGDENNNNDDDDADSQRNTYHQRDNSARSSLASNQRLAAYNYRPQGRYSQGSTPSEGHGESPSGPISELAEETPVPMGHQRQGTGDYFAQQSRNGGSGSSSERESSFGNVGDMAAPSVSSTRKDDKKSAEDLNRRGSVDERASTMRGAVRLFVANPDLSD